VDIFDIIVYPKQAVVPALKQKVLLSVLDIRPRLTRPLDHISDISEPTHSSVRAAHTSIRRLALFRIDANKVIFTSCAAFFHLRLS
jgi:hypothetical protein